MRTRTQQSTEPKIVHRTLLFVLIASIIVASSFIIFSPTEESKIFVGDIIEPISAAIALVLSLIVVYRQKLDGLLGKAYTSLAIGLTLWFIAEVLWSFVEFGSMKETSSLQVADFFWLLGYGPFIYYVFRMYTFFGIYPRKRKIIYVLIPSVVFLAYTIHLNMQDYDFSAQQDVVLFSLSIIYTALDLIFIVLAVLLILSPGRKGELIRMPWIFLAFLIIAVADSGLGYSDSISIFFTHFLYICGYIFMAAGLFWHNRFFIFDEKRAQKKWQEGHR